MLLPQAINYLLLKVYISTFVKTFTFLDGPFHLIFKLFQARDFLTDSLHHRMIFICKWLYLCMFMLIDNAVKRVQSFCTIFKYVV